ncbi:MULTISPECIES: ATP-binding protein [unclassified Lentimicrobium]|uniref:ATP-binding protein n=1 Tax=unclassified Lentimicrobium TaxID=2677434 RepID=UPI0015532A77|nr:MULTISPECIES: ATP-binding protein [unclassified Lentimicrobium]NPD46870.1 hypothetical protein [Lentimicrobium sp. S6]NPD84453.1 hypothetical protein [Lentimicrobium sp. L6]
MNSANQINSKKNNLEIVELDLHLIKITIKGDLSLVSLLEIEKYFSKEKENKQTIYVILDLNEFISIEFKAKQYVFENNFFPHKGFEILVYGLKIGYSANLHLLFHNDSNITVFEFDTEDQALIKAKELSSLEKMNTLAIGPSSFTGIIKDNIKIIDKSFIMIHDKSWNYQHPSNSYYYKIDLLDANIFISRPVGYIEEENSLSANVLFDKVVYKLLGTKAHYYRIQDYTEVLSSSLSARRDFTNYIINNINRIDLMVFYGLNSFMKAIVKFGKLIHPKFYKVKIADSFEEAVKLVLNHKYGQTYFKENAEIEGNKKENGDVFNELLALRKENEKLKIASDVEKRKILEAIGGVLWSDDYEMENVLDNPSSDYKDIYNALKVLKQDINEINQKREKSTKQLLNQTQILTKEVKDCKEFIYRSKNSKKEYFDMFNFEIRSPLQSILSNVELLSRKDKTKENKEVISQLMESSILINKRLKRHFVLGDYPYDIKEYSSTVFNVDKTIQLIVNANLENSISKGLNLIIEKDEMVPKYLIGDEDKLQLIIEQFVTNAIYFTNQGNIIIRTKLIEDYETSVKISFEVEDSGVGMTQEMPNQIRFGEDLNDFYTLNSQGVGFAILKQLAGIINGEIGVKSVVNEGSMFFIQVKFNKGVFSKEMNLKPRTLVKNLFSKKLSDKKLLFILEDFSLKSVYLSQFDEIGIQAKFANNRTHASALLKTGKLDFILVEAPIKQSDVFNLLHLIQENLKLQLEASTKVVFIMSSPDIKYRNQILSDGCDAIINKPYQIFELKTLLESLIA